MSENTEKREIGNKAAMLDEADRKILHALENNPRLPARDLAVASGLTLAQATSRIRRIEKRQLAHIVAVLNIDLMGYRTANIGVVVRGRAVEAVAKDIAQLADVSWLASAYGSGSDLVGAVRFRDDAALSKFVRDDISRIDGVFSVRLDVILETLQFSGRHISFVPPEKGGEPDFDQSVDELHEKIGHVVSDPLDLRLVAELLRNGRSSSRELARRYHLSHGTIGNRIRALESRRVFQLQTLVDPAALGLTCFAFIEIQVEAAKLDSVIALLKAQAWLPYLSLTTGKSNLAGFILSRDTREATRLKAVELLSIDGVRHVEMSILTGNYRVDSTFGYFL